MVIRSAIFLMALIALLASPCQAAEPEINLSLSKERVWQREQAIVTLEVVSNDKLSRLEADEYRQTGFTIVPFELEKTETEEAIRLILKWAIFPNLKTKQPIELPRVRYRPSSGRPKSLKLPQLFLKVRPLPIYVPPTMPVGKVSLKSDWSNGSIISSKKMFEWRIFAESTQVSPQTLPAITQQLVSTANTQILPLQRSIKTLKKDNGVTHQQQYQIPIKALKMGTLKLPEVVVQYFDPETGKLKKVGLKRQFSLVLNQWLLWLIALCLLAILVVSTLKFVPKLKQFYQRRKSKHQALQSLSKAENYQQIRASLQQIAIADNLPANMTLDLFAAQYEFKQLAYPAIKKLLDTLKANEFSAANHQNDIRKISDGLYKLLR